MGPKGSSLLDEPMNRRDVGMERELSGSYASHSSQPPLLSCGLLRMT
jgi:hypothetical protein